MYADPILGGLLSGVKLDCTILRTYLKYVRIRSKIRKVMYFV